MGQVVPFIARVRDSGDWSAAERARLDELADRLAAAGVRVEVIYGVTDDGDPWCAVKDANEEVLIHVARIGGTFVVHSAIDDVLSEGADLHAVLRERLDATPEIFAQPASAEILPFQLRQAQSVLALLAAAAFFYETVAPAPAEAAELPPAPVAAPDAPPPQTDDTAPAQERQATVQGAAVAEPAHGAPAPLLAAAEPAAEETTSDVAVVELASAQPLEAPRVEAPVPAVAEAPADDAPVVIAGTDGDDLLVGGTEAELLQGGAGNDTLQGGGGRDTLDGGAGDDRIELEAQAVAIGGQGADVFVLRPALAGGPDTLLGHIVDFSLTDGDRIFSFSGRQIDIPGRPPAPPTTPESEPSVTAPGDFGSAGFGPATSGPTNWPPAPTRVDVDLDGDGVNDGFLLLGPPRAPPPLPNEVEGEPAVVVVGRAWFDADGF
jgi:hypothetical protein